MTLTADCARYSKPCKAELVWVSCKRMKDAAERRRALTEAESIASFLDLSSKAQRWGLGFKVEDPNYLDKSLQMQSHAQFRLLLPPIVNPKPVSASLLSCNFRYVSLRPSGRLQSSVWQKATCFPKLPG